MRNVRERIDDAFAAYGRFIYRWRWPALLLTVLVTGVILAQIPKMTIDMSTEAHFYQDDPVFLQFEEFQEQFGRDEIVVAGIEIPGKLDRTFLQRLREFHEDLEKEVPHLVEVTSIVNVTSIYGFEGGLVVEKLIGKWPEDESAMEAVRKRLASNQGYRNLLVSEDLRYTAVLIRSEAYSSAADPGSASIRPGQETVNEGEDGGKSRRQRLMPKENGEFVRGIRTVVARHHGPGFSIHLAGFPIVTDFMVESMERDTPIYTSLTILMIVFCLVYLFRRLSGVVLPLLVVILSLLAMYGVMAALGVPVTSVSQILPPILLTAGMSDAIHFLTIFYGHLKSGASREASIIHAMGHSGLPMFMTTLTTACDFLSFGTSTIPIIAQMGYAAAGGVVLALVYTLVCIPSLLGVIPLRSRKSRKAEEREHSRLDQVLTDLTEVAIRRPWTIVLCSGMLGVVGCVGASRLVFSHDPLAWFSEKSGIRQETQAVDREMKGTVTFEVIVDTRVEDGLHEPEIMNGLDGMNRYAEQLREGALYVGKSSSVVDVLKEINRAVHENREEYYVVPQDRDVIGQEMLLFESSGTSDLERLVDSRFSKARVTLRLPWLDANSYDRILGRLEERFRAVFAEKAQITITGMTALLTRTIQHVMQTMIDSYFTAAAVTTLLMMLMSGSMKLGLVGMIPNFLPVLLGLGFMGAMGMPLDLSSILVGGIVIGLVVDDTVHYVHYFSRHYKQTRDGEQSARHTVEAAGRAILFTSILLSGGFFVLVFSSMKNVVDFGLIAGFTIVAALAAELLLTPAVMVLFARASWRK
jgi:hypothetical protein